MTLKNDNAKMIDVDPHNAFRLGAHCIHLDFSYIETTLAPNVPSALFDILTAWNQNVPNATFVDHDGVVIDLDNWPDETTFKYRFSMSIIEARKRHIAVGFSFCTKATFTKIKAISRPLLQKYSAWLYPHLLEFTQLDIVPLGFLTSTNPRFHYSTRVSSDIQELILKNYDDLDSEFRDNVLDEHFDHFDDEGELKMPPIMIAPANVNSGNERTQAYEIQVERTNVGATKVILEAVYSLTAVAPTDQRFISYSLKHESQDIYRSILRTQNEYLEIIVIPPLPASPLPRCIPPFNGMAKSKLPMKSYPLYPVSATSIRPLVRMTWASTICPPPPKPTLPIPNGLMQKLHPSLLSANLTPASTKAPFPNPCGCAVVLRDVNPSPPARRHQPTLNTFAPNILPPLALLLPPSEMPGKLGSVPSSLLIILSVNSHP
jgi:hypothetical protein